MGGQFAQHSDAPRLAARCELAPERLERWRELVQLRWG
jgi:hypothetical protein